MNWTISVNLLLARNLIPWVDWVLLNGAGAAEHKMLVLPSVFLFLSFTESSTCYFNLLLLCSVVRNSLKLVSTCFVLPCGVPLSHNLCSPSPLGTAVCMHFSLPLFTPEHYHFTFGFGFVPSNFMFSFDKPSRGKSRDSGKQWVKVDVTFPGLLCYINICWKLW